MRISRARGALFAMLMGPALASTGVISLAHAQASVNDALNAAQQMASALDGAGGGISTSEQIAALESAAALGDTMALWQLGLMYESGQGVAQDKAKAFGYFQTIASTDTAPRGVDADIVAQSILKVGEYYREGLPEAGLAPDPLKYERGVQRAAAVFGNADAQYLLGEMYSSDDALGDIPVLSYRWLLAAARKGHALAQAQLGSLLFNGGEGVAQDPVRGLMWLTVASRRAVGTPDEAWINDTLNSDMSIATPEQRELAVTLADSLALEFASL